MLKYTLNLNFYICIYITSSYLSFFFLDMEIFLGLLTDETQGIFNNTFSKYIYILYLNHDFRLKILLLNPNVGKLNVK